MKVCRTCGVEKALTDYWTAGGYQKNGAPKRSLLLDCKPCVTAKNKANYLAKKALLQVTGPSVVSKVCKDCLVEKSADEFYLHVSGRGGLHTICKPCTIARTRASAAKNPNIAINARKAFLKRRYGLSMDEFDAMVEAQQGACAICGRIVDQLVVDHNHETGAIRELACGTCNSGIGMFGDDPEMLERAIAYLRKHQLA